jgi:hypothetical protein
VLAKFVLCFDMNSHRTRSKSVTSKQGQNPDMSANNRKTSAGRARGHSMYSSLKATTDDQITGGEFHGDYTGISAARLREHPSPDFNRGSIAQEAKPSLLATALQAARKSTRAILLCTI